MGNGPLLFALAIFVVLTAFRWHPEPGSQLFNGAWHVKNGSIEEVLILQDGYLSHTVFDKPNKKFVSTYGGIYKAGGKLMVEFDTRSTDEIGKQIDFDAQLVGQKLISKTNRHAQSWTRIDEGKEILAGVWRITGRMVDGKVNEMTRGDRKTLKILSGTRFQWVAINPATKEFFGTGGGVYTFSDGKYSEHIEFFSRDSSRVGASLTFDGSVKDDIWNHSGRSSKGEPLNEFWSKEKN